MRAVRLRRTLVGCANRRLRILHLQGASFAYDGVHAQNREALTDRSTFIVRVRSPASRRGPDRAGRLTPGGASFSFSGITRQCEATPGGEGAPTGLRRGYVCRELRTSECRWRGVPG